MIVADYVIVSPRLARLIFRRIEGRRIDETLTLFSWLQKHFFSYQQGVGVQGRSCRVTNLRGTKRRNSTT